jgi:hypothetical protein
MGWGGILGFEYGIVQAPMGPDFSSPQLVAAVANAGALALLRAPDSACSSFNSFPFLFNVCLFLLINFFIVTNVSYRIHRIT